MRGPSPPPLPGALDAVGSSLVPLPPQDGGKRLALHLQSRASQLRVGCRLRSARPVVHTLFIPRFSCWLRSDLSLSLSLSSLFALSRRHGGAGARESSAGAAGGHRAAHHARSSRHLHGALPLPPAGKVEWWSARERQREHRGMPRRKALLSLLSLLSLCRCFRCCRSASS